MILLSVIRRGISLQGHRSKNSRIIGYALYAERQRPNFYRLDPTGDPKETIGFILKTVEDDLIHRFPQMIEKKKYDVNNVAAGREYIEAFIGWVVYSHHLWQSVTSAAGHGEKHEEKAGCGHH